MTTEEKTRAYLAKEINASKEQLGISVYRIALNTGLKEATVRKVLAGKSGNIDSYIKVAVECLAGHLFGIHQTPG